MRAIRKVARIAVARAKAVRRGVSLPPGNFFRLSPYLTTDRRGLVDKAAKLGPIMTAAWDGHVAICVIGFPTARRLLSAHAADLQPISINLKTIVPNGFLRTMEGGLHKRYRPVFSRAFDERILNLAESDIRIVIREGLAEYAEAGEDAGERLSVMERITARLLIRTCLGISPDNYHFAELERDFLILGPGHFVWQVGDDQRQAFYRIRQRLERLLKNSATGSSAIADMSVLGKLKSRHALDPTIIGNLIYMVEMGRYDLKEYFTWIVRFVEQAPPVLARLATDEIGANGCPYSRAVAFETLRMERSERLMRRAHRDFVFDGFLFPRGAVVWISLWEAHKDKANFSAPYTFDPDRFMSGDYELNQYAPFGLDHHRCPAADIVIRLAATFTEMFGTEQKRSRH